VRHLFLAGREPVDAECHLFLTGNDPVDAACHLLSIGNDARGNPVDAARYLLLARAKPVAIRSMLCRTASSDIALSCC
jgi:hypothetical protein